MVSFRWSSNAVKNLYQIRKVTALHRPELSGCSFVEMSVDLNFLVKVLSAPKVFEESVG